MDPSIIASQPHTPGNVRVVCGHCAGMFQVNLFTRALARCPHCHKVSSVGREFARRRGIAYLIPGILFLLLGIFITAFTHKYVARNSGIIASYFFVFLVAFLLMLRGVYFLCIKISRVEGPA
jgi:phosphatidylinositol-4,5-bisphosphate 4-phosphatase